MNLIIKQIKEVLITLPILAFALWAAYEIAIRLP